MLAAAARRRSMLSMTPLLALPPAAVVWITFVPTSSACPAPGRVLSDTLLGQATASCQGPAVRAVSICLAVVFALLGGRELLVLRRERKADRQWRQAQTRTRITREVPDIETILAAAVPLDGPLMPGARGMVPAHQIRGVLATPRLRALADAAAGTSVAGAATARLITAADIAVPVSV